MGLASIKSDEAISRRIDLLQNKNDNLESILQEGSSIVEDEELKNRIRTQQNTSWASETPWKSARYYASAKEFGRLWGEYCTGEQKEKLNIWENVESKQFLYIETTGSHSFI